MTAPVRTATRTSPRRMPASLVALAVVPGLLALTPLVYLAVRALGAGPVAVLDVLTRPRTGELLVRSVALAGAVTLTCVVVGAALAWLLVRSDLPGRRGWSAVLALPLAVPSYVAGFTWIAQWPGTAGFWGAYAVLCTVSYPYVLLPVAAGGGRAAPGRGGGGGARGPASPPRSAGPRARRGRSPARRRACGRTSRGSS